MLFRSWRAQLELVARLQWALARRHPWLTRVISLTRPEPLPQGMRYTEWALRALDGVGLDANAMLHATVSLFGYVAGIAMNFESEAQAEQDTGLTDEEWLRARDPQLSGVLARGAFPTLSRIVAHPGVQLDLDSLFEFGLDRLLDGLAALIAGTKAIH